MRDRAPWEVLMIDGSGYSVPMAIIPTGGTSGECKKVTCGAETDLLSVCDPSLAYPHGSDTVCEFGLPPMRCDNHVRRTTWNLTTRRVVYVALCGQSTVSYVTSQGPGSRTLIEVQRTVPLCLSIWARLLYVVPRIPQRLARIVPSVCSSCPDL